MITGVTSVSELGDPRDSRPPSKGAAKGSLEVGGQEAENSVGRKKIEKKMVYILIELSFHLILRLTSILTGTRSPNRVSRLQGRGSVSTPCIRVSDRCVHTTCQAPSAFENIRSEDLEVLHMTKVKERKIHRIICVLFPNCIGFPKNIFVCVAGPVWPDKILAAQSSHMRAHTHMHTHMHVRTHTCAHAHPACCWNAEWKF